MGSLFSQLLSAFSKKKLEVCVVGLENSGKTTLLHLLSSGVAPVNTTPTVGLNIKLMKHGGVTMKVWDLGGQAACRDEWPRYTKGCDVVLYVVDVSDHRQLDLSKQELHRLLEDPSLERLPLLVVGNKIDLEPHISPEELVKGLNLDYITANTWDVIDISALRRQNIDRVLDWLIKRGK